MKNMTINLILVLTTIAVLTVFAFSVRIGPTPDYVVILRMNGVTCESCADRITRSLETQKGVASVKVDTDAGRVIVWYDSYSVRPETLARVLADAGFTSSIVTTAPAVRYTAMTGVKPGSQAGTEEGGDGGCCRKN